MTWILTASGKHFDFADLQPEQIDIRDIAQALSNEARFNGHTNRFYSVAQHSVAVSRIVPPEDALEGLLHDATEAYMKDIPLPLKRMLPDYKRIEQRVDAVIRARFGLPALCSASIKHADLVMLATERRDLMPTDSSQWDVLRGIEPQPERLTANSPTDAMWLFWLRWKEITGERIHALA